MCETAVIYLGAANTAQPFWEQINSFFRYPLRLAPLGILTLSSAALTIAGDGIISLVIYVSFACIFTKYAYSIIQSSKDGSLEPPSFQSAFSGENLDVFFKQLAVFFVAGLALTPLVLTGSEFLVGVGSFLINGLMPASIIVLALTNRIGAALNPSVLISVVKAIGKRYLLLWVFLFILAQGPIILLSLLITTIPFAILVPTTVMAFGYFAFVMCRLLGYTVYQNQGSLGFVSEENLRESDLSDNKMDALITRQTILSTEMLVKEGEYKRARKLLADRLNQKVKDLTLEDYYHRLLVVMGDNEAVIENAEPAIDAFFNGNRGDLAILVFNDCLKIDKSFKPTKLEASLGLARVLHSKLNFDAAIRLLSNAHKRFPNHSLIPDAYILLAEILILGKRDLEKGHSFVQFVKKQYPTHANHEKFIELELATRH
tara:strand:- start:3836 stop:5125 length:1290 start_codon:yes stop_codon:yes gene_type:complete